MGAWPVQFIPVFSPLTREAVERADTAEFERIPFRVVRADYLPEGIAILAQRHALSDAWTRFKTRFLDD